MKYYSLDECLKNSDRYKIFILEISDENLVSSIDYLNKNQIKAVNLGKELSTFLNSLNDLRFLSIEAYDFIKRLLDGNKSKINGINNEIVAIYNLGILLEPDLKLNAVQLLKEFSKSAALIIIWENLFDQLDKLNWSTQKQNFILDFSDIQLKKLHYAI